MSYLVLARKWRPRTFDEIIGQEHITTILKNSIKINRVAHAYLFAGPRGVGKTTTARVFSKALNCINGPTPEPCLKCTNCKEISGGSSFDVIEIDGASNRGIDQVRDLRESAKLSPANSRFKIYIIDEVHMLTEPAFNALLKILEEPPEHVKFIFATTQPNKLPATILSRCQRFDFRRIPVKVIVEKLTQICNEEKIKFESEALFTIARTCDGSLRDAESILDQLICLDEKKIEDKTVINLLGIISQDIVSSLVDSIIEKDTKDAITKLDSLISQGKDTFQISNDLIQYFRNLFMVKIIDNPLGILNISQETFDTMKKQVEELSEEEIVFILQLFVFSQDRIRYSFSPRIMFEISLIHVCERSKYKKITDAIDDLKKIKEKISTQSEEKIEERVEKRIEPKIIKGENSIIEEKYKISEPKISFDINKIKKTEISPQVQPEKKEEKDSLTAVLNDEDKQKMFEELKKIWPQIINQLKGKKMSLATCLSDANLLSLEEDMITIGFKNNSSFHAEMLEERNNRMLLEKLIRSHVNYPLRVKCKKFKNNEEQKNKRNFLDKILSDPKVKMVEKMFNAKVVKIIPKDENKSSS
jgi:DNA polymerase-3 subunit gamma/tau